MKSPLSHSHSKLVAQLLCCDDVKLPNDTGIIMNMETDDFRENQIEEFQVTHDGNYVVGRQIFVERHFVDRILSKTIRR